MFLGVLQSRYFTCVMLFLCGIFCFFFSLIARVCISTFVDFLHIMSMLKYTVLWPKPNLQLLRSILIYNKYVSMFILLF